MESPVYYYRRENGAWVFSLLDSLGIRRTIEKNEYTGEQYHRMLRYSNKKPQVLYLDLPEDFRTIRRLFFSPSYWADKTWQDEYRKGKP